MQLLENRSGAFVCEQNINPQHAHNSTTPAAASEAVTREEAKEELERILQSPDFPATPRNRNFLAFVVGRALDGADGRVTAYDIATWVFGRSAEFNTILDPIVRIEAGKLRRDLETYYLKSGAKSTLRIDIPLGGYHPRFSRCQPVKDADCGAPPVLTGDPAADAAAELERVLGSPDFPASPRNRSFLAYLVTKELAGLHAEITSLALGQQVFKRGPKFDPNKDPIVRIEAGKLRRDLETYYLKSGARNPLRIVIPKGTYRPRLFPAG